MDDPCSPRPADSRFRASALPRNFVNPVVYHGSGCRVSPRAEGLRPTPHGIGKLPPRSKDLPTHWHRLEQRSQRQSGPNQINLSHCIEEDGL